MARCHFRHSATDAAGNAIQNAKVHLYNEGHSAAITDAYTTKTGATLVTASVPSSGSAISAPALISNDQGEVECWIDGVKEVDALITDNAGLAYYPASSSVRRPFTAFFETVSVYPPAQHIGWVRNETANVWNYGAKGGGVDDTAAFLACAAAVNLAASRHSGIMDIPTPEGADYWLVTAGQIQMSEYTRVRGIGGMQRITGLNNIQFARTGQVPVIASSGTGPIFEWIGAGVAPKAGCAIENIRASTPSGACIKAVGHAILDVLNVSAQSRVASAGADNTGFLYVDSFWNNFDTFAALVGHVDNGAIVLRGDASVPSVNTSYLSRLTNGILATGKVRCEQNTATGGPLAFGNVVLEGITGENSKGLVEFVNNHNANLTGMGVTVRNCGVADAAGSFEGAVMLRGATNTIGLASVILDHADDNLNWPWVNVPTSHFITGLTIIGGDTPGPDATLNRGTGGFGAIKSYHWIQDATTNDPFLSMGTTVDQTMLEGRRSGAKRWAMDSNGGVTSYGGGFAIRDATDTTTEGYWHPDGYFDMLEIADPAAPAANNGRFFMRDNGAGKTQYCVRFPTGAVQVLATEP